MSSTLTVRIAVPPLNICKYYVLTFLSYLDYSEIDNILFYKDKILIQPATATNVNELFAEVILIARDKLEKYYERNNRRVDIPGTGKNEQKGIFKTVKERLGLPEASTFIDALQAYAQRIRGYNLQDLMYSFASFGDGDISLPSIFKPEHYALSRAPFMKSKVPFKVGINLDYFMLLLAGYVLSRVGAVPYDVKGRRTEYQTLHIFPYDIVVSPHQFSQLLDMLTPPESEEGGGQLTSRLPGLIPEEAVIIWLSLIAPKDTPDIILMSMKDPRGQKPAEIGVSYHLPLRSFMARASQSLRKIKDDPRLT
ncbi:MAG: hypothetical protein ACTSUS_08740, partial [Candidatus Freyarchaeota archaeon]